LEQHKQNDEVILRTQCQSLKILHTQLRVYFTLCTSLPSFIAISIIFVDLTCNALAKQN